MMAHVDNLSSNRHIRVDHAVEPTITAYTNRRHLTREPCSTASRDGRTLAAGGEHPNERRAPADRHLVDLADRLGKEADARVEYLKGQSEADKPA